MLSPCYGLTESSAENPKCCKVKVRCCGHFQHAGLLDGPSSRRLRRASAAPPLPAHKSKLPLADRIPSELTPVAKTIREAMPTGIAAIDAVLDGGLLLDAISEMIGAECSGQSIRVGKRRFRVAATDSRHGGWLFT